MVNNIQELSNLNSSKKAQDNQFEQALKTANVQLNTIMKSNHGGALPEEEVLPEEEALDMIISVGITNEAINSIKENAEKMEEILNEE
ncbi:hypothetical protein [Vibrio coralliilyticus]|uniref:hypothetical protein n=1 Tax=Vibrio coralliilyticus TaxID=190893 RepID=UPI00183A8298|nr:hypothetical protein [Vibrio coralliilyticus]NUW68079.1 hypothetical protein [Vibrio coralliilyticus]